MLQFIESIKIENQKIHLVELHQQRVFETFKHFERECHLNLLEIFKTLEHDEDGLYKLRIIYDLDHNFETQMIPYAISEVKDFELVNNNQLKYQFKYLDRNKFNNLKQNSTADEIIIIQNGNITDTSFSNIIFLKNKIWYTPETCLLQGVQRQHLLQTNQIKTMLITLDNISEFSHFKIINAMNNFEESFIYPISKIKNLPTKITDIDDL
ncbi:aminotransferase class IV [Soonwooa purpurea]